MVESNWSQVQFLKRRNTMSDNKTSKNTSIVTTATSMTKKEEDLILSAGSMDLNDFFDNFQYLCFVLDASYSMNDGMGEDRYSGSRKVDLQKKVVEKYANERIGEKALSMKIGVVEFGKNTRIPLRGSSNLDEIKDAVRALYANGNGTYAGKGIRAALTLLKKNKDYTPRIILTSDGDMHDYDVALDAAEQAKTAGVIIDTIFIGREDSWYGRNGSDNLKTLSAITGGVHEEITSEAEFEAKFLAVANRPLLGTGSE